MKEYDPNGVNLQGFVILEDKKIPWGENQLHAYFSKYIGKTVKLFCEPEAEEIEKAVEELRSVCWRVVLVTRAYTIRHRASNLILHAVRLPGNPRVEHISMPFFP
jgi:hypothetical protein